MYIRIMHSSQSAGTELLLCKLGYWFHIQFCWFFFPLLLQHTYFCNDIKYEFLQWQYTWQSLFFGNYMKTWIMEHVQDVAFVLHQSFVCNINLKKVLCLTSMGHLPIHFCTHYSEQVSKHVFWSLKLKTWYPIQYSVFRTRGQLPVHICFDILISYALMAYDRFQSYNSAVNSWSAIIQILQNNCKASVSWQICIQDGSSIQIITAKEDFWKQQLQRGFPLPVLPINWQSQIRSMIQVHKGE